MDGDGELDVVLGMPEWKHCGGILAFRRGENQVIGAHEIVRSDVRSDESLSSGYGVRVIDLPDRRTVIVIGMDGFLFPAIRAYADLEGTVLWETSVEEVLVGIGQRLEVFDFGDEITVVPDQDGDGVADLLTGTSQMHMGGNIHRGAFACILSGQTGKVLRVLPETEALKL
jgi:hypothetical protein